MEKFSGRMENGKGIKEKEEEQMFYAKGCLLFLLW